MPSKQLVLSVSDVKIVEYQTGRNPIKFLGVAGRCSYCNPVVTAQDPFYTRELIFPTVYYLTCPRLVKLIARLESSDFFKDFKAKIEKDELFERKFSDLIFFYKKNVRTLIESLYMPTETGEFAMNYSLATDTGDTSYFKNNSDTIIKGECLKISPELLDKIIDRGFGGSYESRRIKCLHALYGFLVATRDFEERNDGAEFFLNYIDSELDLKYGEEFKDIFQARAFKY